MSKRRKTYEELNIELNAIIAQQKALEEKQFNIFIKAFQDDTFKKALVSVPPEVLKRVSKALVHAYYGSISDYIQLYETEQAEKAEKAKKKAAEKAQIDNVKSVGAVCNVTSSQNNTSVNTVTHVQNDIGTKTAPVQNVPVQNKTISSGQNNAPVQNHAQ
jgi:predicted metal-dependent enzyme (double-stranded beta helix superfamily)